MGIHRLPDGIVMEGRASCPLSAKGAQSPLACGNRPRHSVATCKSAEGALQCEREGIQLRI